VHTSGSGTGAATAPTVRAAASEAASTTPSTLPCDARVPQPGRGDRRARDGDTVALEGSTHWIPHAAGHEIIRQRSAPTEPAVGCAASRARGPTVLITDIGILQPDAATNEFTLTGPHPGQTVHAARAATGWQLRVADTLVAEAPPTAEELGVLRELRGEEP
jgi:hypothetical protein